MIARNLRLALVAGLCLYAAVELLGRGAFSDPKVITVDKLVRQFEGRAYYWNSRGERPGIFDRFLYRNFAINSQITAADMLGRMDPKPTEAVPVLIDALENGPNDIDTGDGKLPYRSTLVMALGQIGDPRAIRPLTEKLKVCEAYTPTPGSTMIITEWDLPVGVAHESIVKALAMFGPEAKDAAPTLEFRLAAWRDYDRELAELVEQTLTKISDPLAAAAVTFTPPVAFEESR